MKESSDCESQKLKVLISITKPPSFLAVTQFDQAPKSLCPNAECTLLIVRGCMNTSAVESVVGGW